MKRPAIRYGRWVVFGNGGYRRLSLREYALLLSRVKSTVRP